MPASYEQFLKNKYREKHPAPGIPVVLSVRSRDRRDFIEK
jgi:predicted GTPase